MREIYDKDWGLYTREKYSKLTKSQIKFLWKKMNKEGISLIKISKE